MHIPPISGSPADPSKKPDKPQKTGTESKIPNVIDLTENSNSPSPLSGRHVTHEASPQEQGRPVGDSGVALPSVPRVGLLNHIPPELAQIIDQELNKIIDQELLNEMIYKAPTQSPRDIADCIKLMKMFWTAPGSNQTVFDTIDVVKFASWVGVNKVPIKDLNLSDQDFKTLLPHLEYLDLSGINFTRFDLLETCKNVKHLNLKGCTELTDGDLKNIAGLTGLKTLNLMHCANLTSSGLKRIAQFTELEFLDLSWCKGLKDADFEKIKSLVNLKTLNLNMCSSLTDASIQHVTQIDGLNSLSIRGVRITNGSIDIIAERLKGLNSLEVGGGTITDEMLSHIGQLTQLNSLHLTSSVITDTGLEHIGNLKKLESLTLSGSYNLTSTGIKHVLDLIGEGLTNIKH